MLITGLSLAEFRGIVRGVSDHRYSGNIIIKPDTREFSRTRFRAGLRTESGRKTGSRTTRSGRHMPIACWHAYRDVLAEVFRQFPDARIEAGNNFHVVYRGAADFAEKYPQTGRENIGSKMEPVTMPELCDCTHEEAYAVIEPDPAVVALMARLHGIAEPPSDESYPETKMTPDARPDWCWDENAWNAQQL